MMRDSAAYLQAMGFLAIAIAFSVAACSQASAPKPAPKSTLNHQKQLPIVELSKLYDPSHLVEVKSLKEFPTDLQTVVRAAGIADADEPCNLSDALDERPHRCFFVGGVGGKSALVALRVGSLAGELRIAYAYVNDDSTWTKINTWCIGFPHSLNELREMTNSSQLMVRQYRAVGLCNL